MFGPVPWVWIRRKIAERWNCRPWEIDQAIEEGRHDEVALELKLMGLEGEFQSKPR